MCNDLEYIKKEDTTNTESQVPVVYFEVEQCLSNKQMRETGENIADYIYHNHLEYDAIIGVSGCGIPIAVPVACILYEKYGMVIKCCDEHKLTGEYEQATCRCAFDRKCKRIIIGGCFEYEEEYMDKMNSLIKVTKGKMEDVVVVVEIKK